MDLVKYHAIKKSELKTRKIEQCAALHFVSYGEKSWHNIKYPFPYFPKKLFAQFIKSLYLPQVSIEYCLLTTFNRTPTFCRNITQVFFGRLPKYLVSPIPIMGTDYAHHNYIKQNEYILQTLPFCTIEVP